MKFASDSPHITNSGGISGSRDVSFGIGKRKGAYILVRDSDLGFVSYT